MILLLLLGSGSVRNLRFIVSYDGTAYSGFQSQPKGNTIQDKLEAAIKKLSGEQVKITASGRTDAGVHARGQVFNFLTELQIPIERWCIALNMRLPNDIVVLHAEEVELDFHSRRSAKRKTYCYTIRIGRFPDVFERNYQYIHHAPLNIPAMREGLVHLIGEHDFTSFSAPRTVVENRVRTIYEARIDVEELYGRSPNLHEQVLRIMITGNGFLYNMVRIIAGTLIQIGEGKRSSDAMRTILAAQDRAQAGPLAQAHGLMLWNVEYEKNNVELSN
jgi:tRNA pseudouridine38-40 synthase